MDSECIIDIHVPVSEVDLKYLHFLSGLELSWVEFIGVLRHMQRYFSHICGRH